MSKKIAIITGASSGMGKVFAETTEFNVSVDEIWAIARREEKLKEIVCQTPVRPIAMDLSDRSFADSFEELLKNEKPEIVLLVNAAGFGKFAAAMDTELSVNLNMLDLNCGATMTMCQLCIPYMSSGSKILNIASVAAFQPLPYINVYAASKAFLLSYSRALNRELKKLGISVTALCPYWTQTEFFDRAINKEASETIVKKYEVMYYAIDVVERGWYGLRKGKDYVTYGARSKFNHMLSKLLPHSFVMNYWMNRQDLN